jgi:hypothetical protein
MFRRKDLCPGPRYCYEAIEEAKAADDPADSGLYCSACPVAALDHFLVTDRGRPFQCVVELDYALTMGFHLTLAEVTWWEFGLLRLLKEERERFQNEEMEKARRNG